MAALRSPRLQSLLMIQASSAYLDRVVAGLRQKLEHMAKVRRAKAKAEARREEAIAELVRLIDGWVLNWLCSLDVHDNDRARPSPSMRRRRPPPRC